MSPDLASRSFAFVGVFIALFIFGYVSDAQFLVDPEEQLPPLVLNIQNQEIKQEAKENIIEKIEKDDKKNHEDVVDEKSIPKNDMEHMLIHDKKVIKDNTDIKQITKNEVKQTPKPQEKPKNENKSTKTVKKEVIKSTQKAENINKNVNTEKFLLEKKLSASDFILNKIKSVTHYPKKAIKRKIQGTVIIAFNLVNGRIVSFQIVKSSGHRILDEAANKLASKLINLDTNVRGGNLTINVPIKYALK